MHDSLTSMKETQLISDEIVMKSQAMSKNVEDSRDKINQVADHINVASLALSTAAATVSELQESIEKHTLKLAKVIMQLMKVKNN